MAFHLLALLFFAGQRHEPAGAADAGAHVERFAVTAGAAAAAADQHCTTGLLDRSSSFCCPKKCGRCGGSSCQNRPGGRADCCTGSIKGSHRYCDSAGPPCIMGGAPPPPAPLHPAHTVNPKRGYVADSPDCGDALLLNASGWFYDYNAVNPYREPRKSVGDCARAAELGRIDERFVPMNWCLDGMDATVAPTVNRTFFMGFNEPNNAHNCNTSPEKVAAAWGTVMKNWSSTSQLVSPATAGNGIKWFDAFFAECRKLYGAKGCQISYLAAHDYSCTPRSTLAYLKQLHERYGYKVWLTEFSCGDGAQKRPTQDHLIFMREILPLLDAADFVYRYSWMSVHDGRGLRGLVEEDSATGQPRLTELGKVWNSAPAHM